MSGYIASWSAVATPLWVLSFMGLALGILLTIRAPTVHMAGPPDLRSQAMGLMSITDAHVLLFDLSLSVSLTWIAESLRAAHN